MKTIYILLSRTGTFPSKVIHGIKGGKFTHTSLSLTPSTDCLYSYARRNINNFLKAGLITENIHTAVFARYPDCNCALYKLDISDKAYEKIQSEITVFFNNYKKAKYSFLGLLALSFGIKIKRKWKLTCSQFVAVILQRSQEIQLPKDPYLMLPNDFMSIPGVELIYEGKLNNCKIDTTSYVSV